MNCFLSFNLNVHTNRKHHHSFTLKLLNFPDNFLMMEGCQNIIEVKVLNTLFSSDYYLFIFGN